jgi:hypothetical protein
MSGGGLGLALAGASAFMQYRAGQAQSASLQAQAGYTRLQAQQEALKQKQQAVVVMDNMIATAATINAYGGMGLGNVDNLKRAARAKGVKELYTVKNNEIIALRGGYMQADQYMMQASAASQAGFAAAIGTFGSGLMMKTSIG